MLVRFTSYVKKHPIQSLAVVVSLVMAFGFYATQYTYNIDRLVESHYSGTVLIGAGRFSAPLLSYLTNWMTFAPFWHVVALCLLLFVSGLVLTLIMQRASHGSISDVVLGVFWIIFATFPIIAYQLTFPTLSVVLPYLLVGIAMWILMPWLEGGKVKIFNLVGAILLLVISVDMYESHAASFLTLLFAVLFLRKWYQHTNEKYTVKYYIAVFLKFVAILATAIIVDFVISKLICYAFRGTFDFWYQTNTTVAWFDKPILDTVKWLIRELIGQYVIAGVSNYNIFMFDVAVLVGLVIATVQSIRKRSAWYAVLYLGLCAASICLAFVLGSAPEYRMAQPMSIFVAFFVMFLVGLVSKKRLAQGAALVVVAILIMNQTLCINRYSVIDYQRYEYESNILQNIAKDLSAYDVESKPVLFVSDSGVESIKFDSTPMSVNNPLANKYKEIMCAFYDAVIPSTTYKRLTARYQNYKDRDYQLSNAKEVADFFNNEYKISAYNLFNSGDSGEENEPEIYAAFDRAGCSLMVPEECRDYEKYAVLKSECIDMPAYPHEGYIVESDDLIIVKIYGNDQ